MQTIIVAIIAIAVILLVFMKKEKHSKVTIARIVLNPIVNDPSSYYTFPERIPYEQTYAILPEEFPYM